MGGMTGPVPNMMLDFKTHKAAVKMTIKDKLFLLHKDLAVGCDRFQLGPLLHRHLQYQFI